MEPPTVPADPQQQSTLNSNRSSHDEDAGPCRQQASSTPHALPAVLTTAALRHQHQGGLPHSSTSGALPLSPSPRVSAPSSPTAASEYSVCTTHASTSSAVPFSHIAQQRKQQERELALQEAAHVLLRDATTAFDLRMQAYTLNIATLQELNEIAAQQYAGAAEIAAALGQFVSDLAGRQAAVKEALSALPQLDWQLELLATAVSRLDTRSRQLEARLGLKPLSSTSTSSSSGAYGYLASGVSQITAAGMSTAAAAAGLCLGGPSVAPDAKT